MILGGMALGECCAKRDACADPLVAGFICLSELAGIGGMQGSDARVG